MVAYWIGRTRIIDPSPMTDYVRLAKLAGEKHPHRALARGGRSRVLEGETAFDRFVLNEFPSVEAALAFYSGRRALAVYGTYAKLSKLKWTLSFTAFTGFPPLRCSSGSRVGATGSSESAWPRTKNRAPRVCTTLCPSILSSIPRAVSAADRV